MVTTGSILATIKAQSENTVPTNSTFDYSKYPNLPIISQENLGYYLGLDSTKSYTLNVDDNTLSDGTNTTQKHSNQRSICFVMFKETDII